MLIEIFLELKIEGNSKNHPYYKFSSRSNELVVTTRILLRKGLDIYFESGKLIDNYFKSNRPVNILVQVKKSNSEFF